MVDTALSVVIPTYNSFDKMGTSLSTLAAASDEISLEVIFVDDGSRDGTFEKLTQLCGDYRNWHAYQLPENSGSAAAPRNAGIERATSPYIFFLDSDDFIDPDGVKAALELALSNDLDVVRSPLYVKDSAGSRRSDAIPGEFIGKTLSEKIRLIAKHQSLTCSFLMRRNLLERHGIRFNPTRRIGEDIAFTSEVLVEAESIGYCPVPVRTYVKASIGNESVTQSISSAQFAEFVTSWREVGTILARREVSFIRERGRAALGYALRQFLWFKTEPISKAAFHEFSNYCRENRRVIRRFKWPRRYRIIMRALMRGDHKSFLQATTLRLVIAGHDLKFLEHLMPKFEQEFAVRIDKWLGHAKHNDRLSKKLLAWGDIFWAEWMLGAAVWYSNRISSNQRLVVRAHRSEMTSDLGLKLNVERTSAIIAIAPRILGDFADRFDIPRSKFWLVPNALDVDSYAVSESAERLNHIGMIGTLPSLKGYHRAILLLHELRREFPKLLLHVYGRRPEELEWLMKIPSERDYFESCERLISELGLREAIIHEGWVDTREAVSDLAAVVSMSDYEGMQVAVAEGYLGGGVGLTLHWRGAEQGYPSDNVFSTPEELTARLRELLRSPKLLTATSVSGRALVRRIYDVDSVWAQVERVLKSIRA